MLQGVEMLRKLRHRYRFSGCKYIDVGRIFFLSIPEVFRSIAGGKAWITEEKQSVEGFLFHHQFVWKRSLIVLGFIDVLIPPQCYTGVSET